MDYFEQLPDGILHHIIDLVSSGDINALFRLRTLSHRFNSLVILKTKHLFLQADKLDKLFSTSFQTSPQTYPTRMLSTANSPNRNLLRRCFNHVTKLVIELPADYTNHMRPSAKHVEVKCMYKATFGEILKSCVILYYSTRECSKFEFSLVMWDKFLVMYNLIEKCACMVALNIVPNLENLDSLVVKDSEGNLEMVMDKEGIRECREFGNGASWEVMPTTVLHPRIRMNQDGCIDIGGGLGQGTVVLGVIAAPMDEHLNDVKEADSVRRAFGRGVHGMVVEKLLQSSFYIDSPLIL